MPFYPAGFVAAKSETIGEFDGGVYMTKDNVVTVQEIFMWPGVSMEKAKGVEYVTI